METPKDKNYLILTIDTQQPVEISDFIGVLNGINNQFNKFVKDNYPDIQDSSKFYLTEVRKGSAVMDLLPSLYPLIEHINHANIIDTFVTSWGTRLTTYFSEKGRDKKATKSDLKDVLDTVKAIASDPQAKQSIEYVKHVDGIKKTKTIIKFETPQAKTALIEASEHIIELEAINNAEHERVTMFFERPSKIDSSIGRRSGEKVIIEDISSKSKPLIYASEMAEQRIKHELNNSDDNPFKKAFIVDVNVEMRKDTIWAYKITHVHQIIPVEE